MFKLIQHITFFIAAAGAGIFFWYDNCYPYWNKDLIAPMESYLYPIIIALGSILLVYVLLNLFDRFSSDPRFQTYISPIAVLGITIPVLNLSISYVCFLINDNLPKIYYIASDGGSILGLDSLALLFVGMIVGLFVTATTKFLSKLLSVNKLP